MTPSNPPAATINLVELDPETIGRYGGRLSESELDLLPYGAIFLDHDGDIRAYNQYETDLSGRRREDVIGRNFFREIAPCTDVPEFAGRFRRGIETGSLNEVFDFVFRFPGRPRQVRVRLMSGRRGVDGVWAFVTAMNDD